MPLTLNSIDGLPLARRTFSNISKVPASCHFTTSASKDAHNGRLDVPTNVQISGTHPGIERYGTSLSHFFRQFPVLSETVGNHIPKQSDLRRANFKVR